MKKLLPLVILIFLCFRSFAQVPVINTLQPLSGPIGTIVTINGSYFSPVAANNIVYFGGAIGKVITATSTKITVTVPGGSTFDPVTVTVNKLTAYAKSPFTVTFPDGNSVFSPTSFAQPTDLALGNSLCYDVRKVVLADFDGDGKTDIAVNNPNGNSILVLKNSRNGASPVFSSVPTATLTTGTTPLQLVAADFDGDGLIDLAVVNKISNTVSIFRNTSTSAGLSFAPKIDLTTVSTPTNIAVGDIDGDGKPDIVVTSFSTNTVSVYKNSTDASGIKFSAKTDFSVYQPQSIAVRDLNGDGLPDLTIANYSGQVRILKNTTTAGVIAFAPEVDFASGNGTSMVTICDFDGDGLPDMIVADYTGVNIYRNTTPTGGNFSFAPKINMPMRLVSADLADRDAIRANEGITPSEYVQAITAGDLDGDGKPDLVVTYAGPDPLYTQISVLKNLSTSGNIKLALNEEYTDNTPYTIGIADLDGDGKPDLAIGTREASTVYWNKNTVTEPTLKSYQTNNGTSVIINGTNLLKTSSLTIGGHAVSNYIINSETMITATVAANTSGTVTAVTPYGTASLHGFTNVPPPVVKSISPISGPVGSTVTITGSNFNTSAVGNQVFFGTAKAAVTAASANSLTVTVPYGSVYQPIKVTTNKLTAYSNLNFNTTFPGGGSFNSNSFAPKTDIQSSYAHPIGITQADFDGDGYLDVAFTSSANYSTSVYVFKNSGNKQTPFSSNAPLLVTASGNPLAVASGDFDGDGKPDMVVANQQTSTLSIFKNTSTVGTLSFAPKVDFPSYDSPQYLFVGDLDGDGKPDIVSVSGNSYGYFSVYHNTSDNGVISFAHKVDYICSGYAKDITMSDLDGDGKMDIIVSGTSGLSIFRNTSINGTISFAKLVTIATTGSNAGLAAGDLNGDGKPDLVVITGANTVSAFKNTSTIGNITFATQQDNYLTSTSFPYYVAINDLNGDGKPDIIVSNDDNVNSVSVFRNTSTSTGLAFDANVNYATGAIPEMIAAGDFNHDAKPDIAVATNGTYGFSLLLSQQGNPLPSLGAYQVTTGDSKSNVKLTGFNLTGATALTIGGTPVTSFSVISDTEITALVSKTAKGTIIVTTPNGTASLDGFVFPSPPVITSYTSSPSGNNTQLIIKGTNLTGATILQADGTPAISFTVNSDSQITAIISASSFKSISVTTPGGTYVYTPTAGPVITSLDVTSGGPGTVVHITGTGFTGTTSVQFGTAAAQSFTVNSSTAITAIIGNTGGSGITVTTPNGKNTFTGFQFMPPPMASVIKPMTARTGDQVTITGSNFTNVSAVTFGGTPAASFTVNSSTSITALVGTGSSGSVVVTTSSGTATLSGFIFNNSPLVTTVNPSVGGEGTQVTITGMALSGVTAVSFGGIPASSFTVVSPTNIIATVGNGTSGSIKITTPNGISNDAQFTFVPKPLITANGPTTFNTGGNVLFSVGQITGYNYQWTKNGVAIPGATTASYSVSTAGSYGVTITVGTYAVAADPIVVDVIFAVPVNNFGIAITSLTCKDAGDGMINVTAGMPLNYTATLTGNDQNKVYNFTNNLAITGLSAGDYSLCFTVQGQPAYSQCFDLVINEPKDLSVYSVVDKGANTLNLTLNGGDNYYIQLNGISYATQQNTITLPLSSGGNKLTVTTDKLCQGKIEQLINISGNKAPYPNPFSDVLYVNLGETTTLSGYVKIYDVSGGHLAFTKQINNQSGVLELDVPQLQKGIYTLILSKDDTTSVFKIIRK